MSALSPFDPDKSGRARALFEEHRPLYVEVPRAGTDGVCHFCLGAVGPTWPQCAACHSIFNLSDCSRDLHDRVVPMTVTLNPSPWYYALRNYKLAQWEEFGKAVACVAYVWLETHWGDLSRMLGGAPHLITIVPSKQPDVAFDRQRLRLALSPLGDLLQQTMICSNRDAYHRSAYAPETFTANRETVENKRIVLVEDTWITGATAISAAGALLNAGAESVVVVPIAREMRPEYHGAQHPYLAALTPQYDVTHWPR